MNILLINHYAGSPTLGMEFRPYYLARQWVKSGHSVTIVGASYSHLRKQQPVAKKDFTIEYIGGIQYIWLKTPVYQNSGFRRFINMLVFIAKLFFYKKRIINKSKPHAVIASSTYPLDIYPAKTIARKCNARLCFEVHDLWPLSPMEIGGYSKHHPFIRLMQAGENYACRKSDVIVSLLGNAQSHLAEHGMQPGKFHHIINGYDPDEWNNQTQDIPAEHQEVLQKLKSQHKTIVGYAGGVNPSNAMKTWAETTILLQENHDLAFVCIGSGSDLPLLKKMTEENRLEQSYFLPPVSKQAIPKLLAYFDIAYVGFVSSILHQYGISPNKITDYMLAGKPIILSADVENEIVEKVGCGITIPAEDNKAFAEAILHIFNMNGSDKKAMGEKGQEYALKELNYEVLAQKFIQVLK